MNNLIMRQQACEVLVNQFKGQPFQWGKVDCMRVSIDHVRRMGSKVDLLDRAGTWASEKAALRSLSRVCRSVGLEPSLANIMAASGLTPIAPAEALPGDIVGTAADAPWDLSLGISLGNGHILGFVQAPDGASLCTVGNMTLWDRIAWRVDPCHR